MARVTPAIQPGFQSQATQVQAGGAWFAGNLVRWRLGLLEKVGGWTRLVQDPFAATIRLMHAWLDLDNRKNLMVATDLGVQLLVQTTVYGLGKQINVSDATFGVTINQTEVTVLTAAAVKAGDSFLIQLPISVGGRIIDAKSVFMIKKTVPGGFVFDMPIAALVTEAGTNGIRLFTNDLVNVMTVTWKTHGFIVGSLVTFAQTTSLKLGTVGTWEQVNFTAPAGTVIVVDTVPSVDTFTFQMGALGTGNGTGTATHQVYDGSVSEAGVATPSVVIGVSSARPIGNPQRMGWSLDNLGQNGLMLRSGGPLEIYTPPITEGPWIDVVASAPAKSNIMFVAMPQAQVLLLGTLADSNDPESFDPLLIRWSHVGTYDVWIPGVKSQAGQMRLSRGSMIVGGIQAPQTTLVITDTDAWAMNYIGPPLVYGFTIMGTGCGLISALAIESLGRTTYWMGQKGFWQYGDGGVQPLLCTVYDYIFSDIDTINVAKIHAAVNSTTNEIAWFFPSLAAALAGQVGQNLLIFSQDFDRWTRIGSQVGRGNVTFRLFYIYEPYYVKSGWYDDVGLMPVAWWCDDLQGKLENITFAPDGTDTAALLQETATTGMHAVTQTLDKFGQRTTYTLSVYAHISSTRNITLRAETGFGSVYATFKTASGTVLATGATSPSLSVAGATAVFDDIFGTGLGGNGWYRYAFTFTSDDGPELDLFINLTNGTVINYLGVPPAGALIWGAQLVLGSDALQYQQTAGFPIQNECTKYVKYNTVEKAWDSGTLFGSAWIDSSVWGPPLRGDANFRIQQHERGYDDDDQPMRDVFAETGYSALGDGSTIAFIDQVQPDFRWFGRDGEITVTLKTTNYPGGAVQNHERYSMTPGTQYFSAHSRARYAAMRYEWSPLLGFSARVGATTFRVKQAGKRP
jgi:hypothetical protein